jgi:putative NADH-flavin reductase
MKILHNSVTGVSNVNQDIIRMNTSNTIVNDQAMLVIGATGSLGRQIVRRALDEGFDVKCIVRPREIPADFLREWGATVINADLTDPSSIPTAMVGIHTVIDAATARPEESIEKVDWLGKVALVQTAQAMRIQRFVFF